MLIVAYDIHDDKLRTKFSTFLKKFGFRLQYSVYKIKNSPKILQNIIIEIEHKYEPKFSQADSVIIFNLSKNCKIHNFGYASNEDDDIITV